MALVEKYFVVAAVHPMGETAVKEGQVVKMNDAQEIVPFNGSGVVFGIAGDTKSTTGSQLPGVYAGWENRVTDKYDETAASKAITVYHNGGEFATDQFEDDVLDAVTGVNLYASAGGKLQAGASGSAIAVLTKAAGPYPSGVPGIDIQGGQFGGDMALKGEQNNQYIEFKLLV